MGCDIHMVLERRIRGEWVGMHSYRGIEPNAVDAYSLSEQEVPPLKSWITYKIMSRNYDLFGELAGVRREGSLGNEPRGLPEDMSQLTRVLSEEWAGDGHSHSHLSLLEFVQAYCASEGTTDKLVAHKLNPTNESSKWFMDVCTKVSGVDIFDEEFDAFRICFWFDN